MSTATLQMPVVVEIPVNHETFRPISERLRERIDKPSASVEEIAAEIEAASQRSSRAREAHLESVKERAQRDIQRAEEAAARKRRVAAEDARRIVEKMEAAAKKVEEHKQEQRDKMEKEKAKRQSLVEAAQAARQAAQDGIEKKGHAEALRTNRAVEVRKQKIETRKQKAEGHLKHALDVLEKKKSGLTERSSCEGGDGTDRSAPLSPHPEAKTPDKKQTLGLGLSIDVTGSNSDSVGSSSKLTPRASPRRTAPELPTIREEIVVANLPGDPVAVAYGLQSTMPNGMSPAATGLSETLSAITNAFSFGADNKENNNAFGSSGNAFDSGKVRRSFERVCFHRVAPKTGFGRSRLVYEMTYADGSKRTVSAFL